MPAKAKGKADTSSKKAAGPLIDGRVSEVQIEKAVSALLKHREKSKKMINDNELPLEGIDGLDGEGGRMHRADVVWMQLTVKRLNANAPVKAVRIPLPHAVWPKSSSVCLLTVDPQRKYKDLMVEEKLTQVKRIVGVTKLKGKFRPFEARRQLMNDHDVFLADERIIAMLPKLLGKKWLEDRKSPIPVALTKTKEGRLGKEITAALASTYFYRNKGTCSSVRLGTLSHLSPAEVKENAVACLPKIVAKHVKGGWENVQSIEIKTGSSVALPVWNSNLNDRWIGMPEAKSSSADGESDTEEDQNEDKIKPIKVNGALKESKTSKKAIPEEKMKKSRSSTSIEIIAPKAVKKARKVSA